MQEARAIQQISSQQAHETRAVRRAKVVSRSGGRYVVEYRGNQITVSSSWPNRIEPETWVDLVQSNGTILEIAGPTGYSGG